MLILICGVLVLAIAIGVVIKYYHEKRKAVKDRDSYLPYCQGSEREEFPLLDLTDEPQPFLFQFRKPNIHEWQKEEV